MLAHDLDEAFASAGNIPDAGQHNESQIEVRQLLMRSSGGRGAWTFILHLASLDRAAVVGQITKKAGAFYLDVGRRTCLRGFAHDIVTQGPAVRGNPIRLHGEEAMFVQKSLNEETEFGMLERGPTAWGSFPFATREGASGLKRKVVVDFRIVNRRIVRSIYHLRRCQDLKQEAAGACFYSGPDGAKRSKLMMNTPDAREVLAVISLTGPRLSTVLQLGPTNGPFDFQFSAGCAYYWNVEPPQVLTYGTADLRNDWLTQRTLSAVTAEVATQVWEILTPLGTNQEHAASAPLSAVTAEAASAPHRDRRLCSLCPRRQEKGCLSCSECGRLVCDECEEHEICLVCLYPEGWFNTPASPSLVVLGWSSFAGQDTPPPEASAAAPTFSVVGPLGLIAAGVHVGYNLLHGTADVIAGVARGLVALAETISEEAAASTAHVGAEVRYLFTAATRALVAACVILTGRRALGEWALFGVGSGSSADATADGPSPRIWSSSRRARSAGSALAGALGGAAAADAAAPLSAVTAEVATQVWEILTPLGTNQEHAASVPVHSGPAVASAADFSGPAAAPLALTEPQRMLRQKLCELLSVQVLQELGDGERYKLARKLFKQGCVASVQYSVSTARVGATVFNETGSRRYDVSVPVERPRTASWGSCSCADFAKRRAVCKHILALLSDVLESGHAVVGAVPRPCGGPEAGPLPLHDASAGNILPAALPPAPPAASASALALVAAPRGGSLVSHEVTAPADPLALALRELRGVQGLLERAESDLASQAAGRAAAEQRADTLEREVLALREDATADRSTPMTCGSVLRIGTPLECLPEWVLAANAARRHVWLSAYTFDLGGAFAQMEDALVRAKRRGVDARVVIDRSWATGASMTGLRPTILRLQAFKVLVCMPPAAAGTLHHKGFLADDIASYGSANWTRNSLTLIERVVVVRLSPTAAAREKAQFETYFEGAIEWDAALGSTPGRR